MSVITHHIPDDILASYNAGKLDDNYALVVAAHVSLCDACRAQLGALDAVGGAMMEMAGEATQVSESTKTSVLAMLDTPPKPEPEFKRYGVFPGPVMQALKGKPPKWRRVGGGIRQQIIQADAKGSVRLLYIPPGQAVPDHGHQGLEMTLVLQGAFHDETGTFGVGDVECADDDLEHTPIAAEGAPCICLAATDAPLRFNSSIPRLLQPLLRI